MKKILPVLFIVSLVATACGGGAKSSTTIDVTMTDFQFTPNVFTVPAGQEITLNAANNGAVTHNFVIMKLGTEVGDAFDDADLPNVYWKADLPAGSSGSLIFTAPTEPGEYQVVCSIPGHMAAGMSAKLVVVAGE